MRGLFKTKRAVAIGTTVVAIAALGIGAFAYWTATGSGSGTGSVGTAANDLQVTGTASVALTPGNSSSVTFVAGNPEAFPQTISSIHLVGVTATVSNVVVPTCGGANTGSATTTTGPDFWMADVPVTVSDGQIAAHASSQGLAATGTLHMNNLTTQNQDTCKNASLILTFTTS